MWLTKGFFAVWIFKRLLCYKLGGGGGGGGIPELKKFPSPKEIMFEIIGPCIGHGSKREMILIQ